MKINRTELQTALEQVRPGLSNKEIIEQTTSFIFSNGRIATYNDEISVSYPFPLLSHVQGVIKAQALYDFLGKVKKDEVELEWTEQQLIIKAGRSKAGFTLDAEIRAPLDEIGQVEEWEAIPKPDEFLAALKTCVPHCSRDMSRPALTCVHVTASAVEASDSYQIIQYQLSQKLPTDSFLLPASSCRDLLKYPVIEISKGESWLHFRTAAGVVFSVRTIQDSFPDISHHLQIEGAVLTLPDSMGEILERGGIFAKDDRVSLPILSISLKDSQLVISASNEFGWIEERAKVKDYTEELSFTIGADFLQQVLTRTRTCIVADNKIMFQEGAWKLVIAVMESESKEVPF